VSPNKFVIISDISPHWGPSGSQTRRPWGREERCGRCDRPICRGNRKPSDGSNLRENIFVIIRLKTKLINECWKFIITLNYNLRMNLMKN